MERAAIEMMSVWLNVIFATFRVESTESNAGKLSR